MDERKLEWESLAERRIREATERGEFDDLPGAGKPLPGLDETYDPNWWVKEWLRRAGLEDTANELRRTIRRELPRLRAATGTPEARARLEDLNEAIEALNQELAPADRLKPL